MQIKQGMFDVACWLVQYNKISFEDINRFTVYNVYNTRDCGCYFLDSYKLCMVLCETLATSALFIVGRWGSEKQKLSYLIFRYVQAVVAGSWLLSSNNAQC